MNNSNRTQKALIYILLFAFLLASAPSVSAETAGTLAISCTGEAYVGETVYAEITLTDIKQDISGVDFELAYNSDILVPLVKTNENDEMAVFLKSVPDEWEQMCRLDEQNAVYYLRAAAGEGKKAVSSTGELVLSVPFEVKSEGEITFFIADSSVMLIGADDNLTVYGGTGANCSKTAKAQRAGAVITLSCPQAPYENGEFFAEINFKNLSASSGIMACEFKLEYDKSAFTPLITDNTALLMDSFMYQTPNNSWEQMCTYSETDGYVLRFAAISAGGKSEELLMKNESMVFRVPFIAKSKALEIGKLTVAEESIIVMDSEGKTLLGEGSALEITVIEGHGEYLLSDGYVCKIKEKTEVSTLKSSFTNSVIKDKNNENKENGYVATGDVLYYNGSQYTAIISGDINGDGVLSVPDYMMCKRACLGSYTLTNASLKAACISGGDTPTSVDYLKLKRHILGSYNIFGEE